MARGRLVLELDFETGDYNIEVQNIDSPGEDIPLGPLQLAFEHAVAKLTADAEAAVQNPDGPPAPDPMDGENSITSGRIKLAH